MDALVEDIIRSFSEQCVISHRSEVAELFSKSLHNEGNEINFGQFADHIQHFAVTGLKNDMAEYLRHNFLFLPEGLRLKLTKIIRQTIDFYGPSVYATSASSNMKELINIARHEQVKSCLMEWEGGNMSVTDLFNELTRLLYQTHLNQTEYSMLISKILSYSGHTSQNEGAVLRKLSIGNMSDIIAIKLSKCLRKMYLQDTNGSLFVLDARSLDLLETLPFCGYVLATSDPLVRYRVEIELQDILTISPSHLVDHTFIHIGRTLSYQNKTIEIESVASFDSYFMHEWKLLVFAVRGRWVWGGDAEGQQGGEQNDGASDICRFEDSNNSPNDSSFEMDQRFMPSYDSYAQYFLVIASTWNTFVKVDTVLELHDIIEPDQSITTISFLSPKLIVFYGSNGLLAVIRKGKVAGEEWRVETMVQDDFQYDDALPPSASRPGYQYVAHSHCSTSVILAVDYDGVKQRLVSADNLRVMCVWDLTTGTIMEDNSYNPAIRQRLIGTSLISIVKFGQNSDYIYVIMADRILITQVVTKSQDNSMVSGSSVEHCLQEISVLDVYTAYPTKYLLLSVGDYLSIWRFREEREGGTIINYWSHHDITSLAARMKQTHTSSQSSDKNFLEYSIMPHAAQNSLQFASVTQGCQEKILLVLPTVRLSTLPVLHSPTHINTASFRQADSNSYSCFVEFMHDIFGPHHSTLFVTAKPILAVLLASFQPMCMSMLVAATEIPAESIELLIRHDLQEVLTLSTTNGKRIVKFTEGIDHYKIWLCSTEWFRRGREYWIDPAIGHNLLCFLYLKLIGNKSVAVEHTWQSYFQVYGPLHLRRSSRALREITIQVRKLDEMANIRGTLPWQIGYIAGLQEIYARRVGLGGRIPKQLAQLKHLRVLSLGNNRLSGPLPQSLGQLKHLQRIVLHQNNLSGQVPHSLGELGCIVNLAGNPRLEHGPDVNAEERNCLVDLFQNTSGWRWVVKTHWTSSAEPVSRWYKVGVLSSHVHSLVMSSNGMDGHLPESIGQLTKLRMIELATMPGLTGPIPYSLYRVTTLRRLCICRCELLGSISPEIGNLVGLEELQLFGNKLTGTVPDSLGKLVNLRLLSLGEYTGGNFFTSAPLPACIAKLKNLEALFMANCNLRGALPGWIGELKELRQLDLQRNMLSGSLPPAIGQLHQLLYLNLKDNVHLSGRLPVPELSSLTKLNRLSLVHCNFAGKEATQEALRQALPRCKIWM